MRCRQTLFISVSGGRSSIQANISLGHEFQLKNVCSKLTKLVYNSWLFIQFIGFISKMIKSKSHATQLTASSNKLQVHSQINQLNYQTAHSNMFFSPKPATKQSKFSKKFVHKPTEMNIFKQTEEKDRKPCLKVIEQGRRVTMFETKSLESSLKKGEFSHLSNESPIHPFQPRNFQDFGAKLNRKKTSSNHNLSVGVHERLTANVRQPQSAKQCQTKQRKHYQIKSDFKKNLEWIDPKKKAESSNTEKKTQTKSENQAPTKNSYLQTHMKYRVLK